MAHLNRVLRSVNNDDASRCVDIFLRPEGTIGFEEYRRDVEDGRGWFPVGGYANRMFNDEGAAFAAAAAEVPWLRQAMGPGGA
ncbi:MAG: hypothetical protein JO141_01040 [Bradyrhizobium sp.]|nr:hypothetical protein [Bradyrhizobium sp.]